MSRLKKVGFWPALLSGGLLTAPLTGLLYLADKLGGLPFTPFALFDWIARVLPGVAVTFGIDMMIEGLRFFGMSVAASAKTAEQIVAVLLFFVIGVVLSAAFLCVMKIRQAGPRPAAGLALGLIFGVPMVAVSLPMGQSTVDPGLTAVVLAVLFVVWGLAFMPMYDMLLLSADGLPTEDRIRWAKSINRRQFLVGVGAATATVTVLSVGIGGVLARSERRQVAETVATSMDPASTGTKPPLPNADDPVVPAPGTRPEYTPVEDHYKVFLRSEPSIIDGATWSLAHHRPG